MMRMKSPERASQYSVGFYPMFHSQCIGLCLISTANHFADGVGMHGFTDRIMAMLGMTSRTIWRTKIGRSPMDCGCLSGISPSSSLRRVEPYAPLLSPYGALSRQYTDGDGMHGFTDVITGTRTTRTARTTRMERMDSPERASQYSVGFYPMFHSQCIGLCLISTDNHFADGVGMHGFTDWIMAMLGMTSRTIWRTKIGRSPISCECLSGISPSSSLRRVEPYAPLLSPYGAFHSGH